MRDSKKHRLGLWLPILVATAVALWFVPDLPFAHLSEPSYWGVLGYALLLALLLRRSLSGRTDVPGRLLALTLAAMPLIYLASWGRNSGSNTWFWIELAGFGLFGIMAYLGRFRSQWWLVAGLAGHGLWDYLHVGKVNFIPAWYSVACAIVDVGLSVSVASVLWLATGQQDRN